MALKQKSAVFQVRVDPDLLDLYRTVCEERDYTVSEAVRRHMVNVVTSAGKSYLSRNALARTDEAPAVVKSAAPSIDHVDEADEDEEDIRRGQPAMTRQQRRKAERDAKKGR